MAVAHSNGYPAEIEINGKPRPVGSIADGDWDEFCPPSRRRNRDHHWNWWKTVIERFSVTVAIAIGDWDAADIYAEMLQHPQIERLIWLDNAYSRTAAKPRDRSKWAFDGLRLRTGADRTKLTYRDGCKDAVTFIENIR